MPLESALAGAIVDHIVRGSFLARMRGREGLAGILQDDSDEDAMPVPSIDHWIRESIAAAAIDAVESLSTLELISRDRNISGAAGTLRPDVLALDRQRNRLVCFEFKRSAEAARQALTELLAYEQEMRNHLPLTGGNDVVFVLMSTEWSTLLDHAAAAAIIFGKRRVLCLEVDTSKGLDAVSWTVRMPSAWSLLGGTGFPIRSLLATTLILTPTPQAVAKDDKKFSFVATQGLELLARELDRIGAHGAGLLWQDVRMREPGTPKFGITIAHPNSYRFYEHAKRFGLTNRSSALAEFLDRNGGALFGSTWQSADVDDAVRRLRTILAGNFDVDRLGQRCWWSTRNEMISYATPQYVESWGVIGEFIRREVTHAGLVSRHPRPPKDPILPDWRAPSIALNVIDELDGRRIFRDGFIACGDAFELGRMLGTSSRVRNGAPTASETCETVWNDIEMIGTIKEVQYLATAAVGIPDPPVRVPIGRGVRWEAGADDIFAEWVRREFLGGLPPYVDCFDIGRIMGLANGDTGDQTLAEAYRTFVRMFVNVETSKSYLEDRSSSAIAAADAAWSLLGLTAAARQDAEVAMMELEDMHTFASALPEVARAYDGIFLPHFVKQKPVKPRSVDWDWFREGIALMIDRGVHYPGIVQTPDGKLSTTEFPNAVRHVFRPRRSADDPVLFSDFTTGTSFVTEVSWADLRAGKVIPLTSG
ncbi:MAG: hypothetical protein JWM87_4916 [Candidatus Eremiobacteraeota bacterium]|nr:hypothetical protein [Candidatus Eremiobacteraeota bacterium]